MYRQNSYNNRVITDFHSITEAEDAIIALSNEIKTIENQLQNRGRLDHFANRFEYNAWKKKAQIAMTMKIKQLEYAKRWLSAQKNGSRRVPNENDTTDIDLSLPATEHPNVIERRPNADKVIDNLCGAILQMRAMKRRLYTFYKIANAAYDVLKETGVNDELESQHNLVYWLERAGYDVNLIEGAEDRRDWVPNIAHSNEDTAAGNGAYLDDDYDYDNFSDED